MEIRPNCPPPAERPPRVVAIGDSLTAGTQDSTTVENRQAESYMPQLTRQAGVPFGMAYVSEGGIGPRVFLDGQFNYGHAQQRAVNIGRAVAPLERELAEGRIPADLTPIWNIPNMGQRTEESKARPGHPQSNFAVPGYEIRHVVGVASTEDYLREMRDGSDATGLAGEVPLVRALIQNGTGSVRGTALDQAIRKRPDLTVVWAGNNDALETVGHGRVDDRLLTPVEDRRWTYFVRNPESGQWEQRVTENEVPGFRTSLLGENGIIPRLLEETRSEILLLTLPDVTAIPVLRPLGQPVGDLPYRVTLPNGTDVTPMIESWVLPNGVRGEDREFAPGSKVSLANVLNRFVERADIQTPEQLRWALDEASERGLFSDDDVLDAAELQTISTRIRDYNAVITEAAGLSERIHLVDMHGEFERMLASGRALRGDGPDMVASTHFTGAVDGAGREGMFSYDGVHPSDTGHAVVANILLDKIKAELGDDPRFRAFTEAPPIDEKAALARDPHHSGSAAAVVLGR